MSKLFKESVNKGYKQPCGSESSRVGDEQWATVVRSDDALPDNVTLPSTYTLAVDFVGKLYTVHLQEFYALGSIHQLLKTFIIESCPCGTLPFDHLSLCWKNQK